MPVYHHFDILRSKDIKPACFKPSKNISLPHRLNSKFYESSNLKHFLAIALLISCSSEDKKPLLQYVDITIGTAEADTPAAKKNHGDKVDFGQTIPAVTAPFGMTQWTPQNRMSERKCLAPYYMDVDIIQGFRATHWTSGSCVQDYGSFTLMPVSDYFNHQPAQRQAKFLFDTDQMSPAYSSFNIPQYLVITEITATKRCGFFKFSWMEPTNPAIIFDVNSDEGQGYIKIDPERREVIASNPVHRIYNGHGQPAGFSGYMVARFDCDFEEFGPYSDYQFFKGETELSNISKLGAYVMLKPSADDVVRVKIGTSFTSIENARENLDAEIPDWDFNRVRAELENTWENLLNQVKVEGGTQEELTKFYTAIYHSTLHPGCSAMWTVHTRVLPMIPRFIKQRVLITIVIFRPGILTVLRCHYSA
jgi:putative alpha-1,2-mannosidase